MKRIPLTQGQFALVDDDDYERIAFGYSWYACRRTDSAAIYAKAYVRGSYPMTTSVWMHRLILNAERGWCVDHINFDTLDNRRANLRLCTRSQSGVHTRGHSLRAMRYKGIRPYFSKFEARLTHKGKYYYLGSYPTAELAAQAYDKKSRELYGEFAYQNLAAALA